MRLTDYREAFIDYLIVEKNYSKSTAHLRDVSLTRFLEWIGNQPFTVPTCRKYIYYLQEEGLKPGSINAYIYTLKMFAEFLTTIEKVGEFSEIKNLSRLKVKESLPDYFTVSEMKKLINAPVPNNYGTKETYSLLFTVQASTGMRIGEVCNLRPRDLVESDDGVYIHIKKR